MKELTPDKVLRIFLAEKRRLLYQFCININAEVQEERELYGGMPAIHLITNLGACWYCNHPYPGFWISGGTFCYQFNPQLKLLPSDISSWMWDCQVIIKAIDQHDRTLWLREKKEKYYQWVTNRGIVESAQHRPTHFESAAKALNLIAGLEQNYKNNFSYQFQSANNFQLTDL